MIANWPRGPSAQFAWQTAGSRTKLTTARAGHVPPGAAIIELHDVVKVYSGLGGQVTALAGIDFAVRPGEFAVLTGKSGSGKTTLVNCLTGLDRCTSGRITVNGTAVERLTAEQAARWRRENVGVV